MIELKHIFKSYTSGGNTVNVLKDVSLRVCCGDMLAVMGVSGSGKSTLLHIMGLIDRPDKGEVFFEGSPIEYDREDSLARKRNISIGFVFQFYSLSRELNVLENVMLPAMIGGNMDRGQRARELLELVGLEKVKYEAGIHQLSGGEMQRVAIARALINEPKVVIADEPTANLDRASSIGIVSLMGDINERTRQTFVIATHSEEIASMCKRIIYLSDGAISDERR